MNIDINVNGTVIPVTVRKKDISALGLDCVKDAFISKVDKISHLSQQEIEDSLLINVEYLTDFYKRRLNNYTDSIVSNRIHELTDVVISELRINDRIKSSITNSVEKSFNKEFEDMIDDRIKDILKANMLGITSQMKVKE